MLIALASSLVLAAPASADFGFLRAWGTVGNDDGQFGLPDGIGVDSAGTVWVADRDNNRIERFSRDGRFRAFKALRRQHRSALPGRLNLPYDVAPDALGNLYVADDRRRAGRGLRGIKLQSGSGLDGMGRRLEHGGWRRGRLLGERHRGDEQRTAHGGG